MSKLVFLVLLYASNLLAQDWTKNSFREDSQFQYWVGISGEHSTEKAALNEAYQEALNEAAKYNYGFKHKVVENTYSNKNTHQIHQESEWNSERILFKGIKPLRQNLIEKNGKFLAFREISYPKEEISKELTRLKSKTQDEESPKSSGPKINTYGSLKIKSNTMNLKVDLSNANDPSVKSIVAPAELTLPTGHYYLTAAKDGYKTISKEIIVSGGENFINLDLETTLGTITVKTSPSDAKIKINGKPYSKSFVDLAEGTYNIEISHPNFFTQTEEVEILNGAGVYREYALKPKKSAVTILSEPSAAEVFINGTKIGQTPLIGHPLSAEESSLNIILIKEGYELSSKDINYYPNKSLEPVNFNLKKIQK